MKGPIPEADAKIIKRPKKTSTKTIGNSHHSFRAHKKPNNSRTTKKLDPILRKKFLIVSPSLSNDKSIHIKCVDIALAKCIKGIERCRDYWLAPEIKACIEQYRNACSFSKQFNSAVI